MEVVYCFIGLLPSYIVDAVYQTRLFFPGKITLLCNDLESPFIQLLKPYNLNIIDTKSFIPNDFIDCANRNEEKFCVANQLGPRKNLFLLSFARFFYLKEYMTKYSVSNVLFLELDVLIYKNPEELLNLFQQKEITLSYVANKMTCSGYTYIKDIQILNDITSYFIEFIDKSTGVSNDTMSEMSALSSWLNNPRNKQRVWMLPGLWQDDRYTKDIWEHFSTFQETLFDGAGIAIRVDGPDACHRKEWERRGKVWWGTEVQYSDYTYEWRMVNGYRVLHLQNPNGPMVPVNCLHVHNKNLQAFLSKPIYIPPTHDFIHGDRFLHMANRVLRTKTRSDYYEVPYLDPSSCLFFEDIPDSWDNPSLLFCNTEDVRYFKDILPKMKNKFVLLSHNSDENVTATYRWLPESDLLVHWFTQNLCEDLPKTSFLPIGIANSIWQHGNPELFHEVQKYMPEKHIFIYSNFRIHTNPAARQYCHDTLKNVGIPFFPIVDPIRNLLTVAASHFAICPEGNGKDTHRFWEALLHKTIPVVLRSPMTERIKKDGYPCVLLDDWKDIHPSLLQYTPEVFTPELQQKLGFSYFKSLIEEQVTKCKAAKRWALTLVANHPYIQRALNLIQSARTLGKWQDDIVLMVPSVLARDATIQGFAQSFHVLLIELPEIDLQSIFSFWNSHTNHEGYSYVKDHPYIYMKFFAFHTMFRNWDYVFYVDSNCVVQGDLNRMKSVCTDTTCIYAHSDTYPFYEWKLRGQFFLDLLSASEKSAFESEYSLDTDYFQSTLMIYNTKILEESTVESLFQLAKQYPISKRMDQGILNLYFFCKKNLWKPLPLKDSKGWLYDYLPREEYSSKDYLLLKIVP